MRPEHSYSDDMRRLVGAMLEGRGKRGQVEALSARRIAKFDGAPSEGTLASWRKAEKSEEMSDNAPAKKGRAPTLTEVEELVVAGWALRRGEKGKPVTVKTTQLFVREAFGEEVSDMWVSRLFRQFGFSSRRARNVEAYRLDERWLKDLVDHVVRVRDLLDEGGEEVQLVAVDESSFYNSPVKLRSYAPKGGCAHVPRRGRFVAASRCAS
jgi:transposase